jgi:6-phospho-beta-glucosidase
VTRAEQIQLELPAILESYRREADADDPRPLAGRYSAEHGDYAVGLIAAVLSGEPARFILNLPNRGAISDLPDDAVVEVPCMLHGREITRQEMGPLPAAVSGLARQMVAHAELAAEAAVTGDRELALQAMMAHPLVHSLSTGQAVLDELLDAHADHLPQFA